MEHNFVSMVLAIGFACWLAGFGLSRNSRSNPFSGIPSLYIAASIGLPIIVFLATLPSHGKLFAPGHDLGNGFIIGAAGALLSSIVVLKRINKPEATISPLQAAAMAVSPFCLASVCAAVPLLLTHDTLYILMLGVSIGWLTTISILLVGLMQDSLPGTPSSIEPVIMTAGAAFSVLLCSAVTLGAMRTSVTFNRSAAYVSPAVAALMIAVSIPLVLLIGAGAAGVIRPAERSGGTKPQLRGYSAAFVQILVAALGIGLVGKVVSRRVLESEDTIANAIGPLQGVMKGITGTSHLFGCLIIGIAMSLLIWWIHSSSDANTTHQHEEPVIESGWLSNGLSMLVALSGVMASYQLMAGFGVTVCLLSGWVVIGLALGLASEAPQASISSEHVRGGGAAFKLVLVSVLGALVALFRVYTSVYEGDFPVSPYTDQYAAFGFLAGAAMPLFLSGYLLKGLPATANGPSLRFIRLIVSAAILLGAPALMLMLWGQKSVMAFLTALAVAAVGSVPERGIKTLNQAVTRIMPAIYSLGLALALCEWSHYVLDSSDWTRIQKERVAVQLVGAIIVAVLAVEGISRIPGVAGSKKGTGTTQQGGGVR